MLLGIGRHLLDCFFAGEPGERARVDELAIEGGERHLSRLCGSDTLVRHFFRGRRRPGHTWFYYLANFNPILFRKLKIPLIMRRNAHDGAGSVVHQNVIRHPDRDLLAVIRVNREVTGIHAMLFNIADVARFLRFRLLGNELVHFLAQLRIGRCQLFGDRMLRRELDRSCSEDRVDASSKDRNRFSAWTVQRKIDQRAFASADPVALHDAHFFRPTWKAIQVAEQLIRVIRNTQEPLFELSLLDRRVFMPPSAASDDLLIGKHGGAFRTPVHFALFAIGKATLE